MKTYWLCLDCDERGEGDKAAERHTKTTTHGTVTTTRQQYADKILAARAQLRPTTGEHA